MSVIEVSDATFESTILNNEKLAIVDFWAEWCGPCKIMSPLLDSIAANMNTQVTIAKLNVDENPDMPGKLGIRGLPTLMAFHQGKMIDQRVGAMPQGQLEQWIQSLLAK